MGSEEGATDRVSETAFESIARVFFLGNLPATCPEAWDQARAELRAGGEPDGE